MKICESGPVICRASGQASADTLNETCPCLTCDHEAPIVAGAYCMAGNFVDRNTNQNGCGVRENASFTLNTVDRHAVAYDARHHCLGGEVSGTLQAKGEGGWSLNYINPVLQPLPENTVGIDLYNGAVTGNTAATLTKKNDGTSSGPEVAQRKTPDWIVRRLIPMECGRLQGFPDIKGFLIEPVDIITFGSPCQDLSIAGKRAGLNGAKSGLFWEAIRIIWEMLLATGGKYPRFVIWENVPGALSSNKGKDFEVVLNELLHLREFAGGRADQSILQHGKWGGFANYGAVAYRIVNAQWWGIPQRRRRVYAVCDTRRESAGVVVFERKGTEWNFEPCIPQGEEVTGLTADCYSWHDRMVATKPCGGGAAGSLHNEDPQRM